MSFKGLQQQLDQASKAFKALDGELATVKYNPRDPASVEAAVVQIEQAVDRKIAPYRGNSVVEKIATQLKQKHRQDIFDRAASERLQTEKQPES